MTTEDNQHDNSPSGVPKALKGLVLFMGLILIVCIVALGAAIISRVSNSDETTNDSGGETEHSNSVTRELEPSAACETVHVDTRTAPHSVIYSNEHILVLQLQHGTHTELRTIDSCSGKVLRQVEIR